MVDSRDTKIAIGKVRTSHGLRGFLKVESYSGETEHFTRLRSVELRDGVRERSFSVEAVRIASGTVLMKLRGLETPEAARALSGWELVVARDKAAPLGNDEYYLSDLCRCEVVKEGRVLGRVRSVCEGGGGDLLEVEVPSGKRYFVPFRSEFVGEVDVEGRIVELEADWLLQ